MSLDDFVSFGKTLEDSDLQAIASFDPAVTLWLCGLDRDAAALADCAALLSPEERARAARFGTERLRQRYIVGRATLRRLLGQATGRLPADVPLRCGRRGRPELTIATTIDFNVSHAGDIALIGLARDTRIGVDIERADRVVDVDRLARKVLAPDEWTALAALPLPERRLRFLQLWTCKEAMSKATADGLAASFGRLHVALGEPPRLIDGPAPYIAPHWRLFSPTLPPDWLATIALWTGAGGD